ncbi:hypothetical protein BKA82DRAFT_4111899 [Pisolithus tinctorius]|nr:hypothetical protein BKA82DRAFT_4111899 [Pisolithus tinctorius]
MKTDTGQLHLYGRVALQILIGERAHLIEFPSVLLPPGSTTGSIVNIAVHQNLSEERKRDQQFWQLQHDIFETFGCASPEPPRLETSVTLEWPPIKLATAKLRSLDIYKNSQRVAAIPSALTNTSTKLSGLSLDTPYTFQLVLRTSAGTFHSKHHTSGISVCFGTVADPVLLEDAKSALHEMKAKWSDKIQIDTTHFVCTTPAMTRRGPKQVGGNVPGGPGVEYQKALQLSIPVVQPQWILACLTEKKMVPIAGYYLGVTPPNAASYYSQRTQSMSQASLPSSGSASSAHKAAPNRSSMPAPPRSTNGTPPSNSQKKTFEPTPEDPEAETEAASEHGVAVAAATPQSRRSASKQRNDGSKLQVPQSQQPPQRVASPPSLPSSPPLAPKQQQQQRPHPQKPIPLPLPHEAEVGEDMPPVSIITPSSVEVPPPPPVEKESSRRPVVVDEGDEDVGETVEIDLR